MTKRIKKLPLPLTLEDRLSADVFQKSYRRYMILKQKEYRYSDLAPQSVGHLQTAVEENWSVEKIGDFLLCDAKRAEACLKRFTMSKKINSADSTAGKIRQGIGEWLTETLELDETAREKMTRELLKILANQLYGAAMNDEKLDELSKAIEKLAGQKKISPFDKPEAGIENLHKIEDKPVWGPQWKN